MFLLWHHQQISSRNEGLALKQQSVSQTHKLEVKMLLHCFLALDTLIENYQASRTYWNCRYAVTIATALLFRGQAGQSLRGFN